jgi:hypothetical protein
VTEIFFIKNGGKRKNVCLKEGFDEVEGHVRVDERMKIDIREELGNFFHVAPSGRRSIGRH